MTAIDTAVPPQRSESYAAGRAIGDADSHIMESATWLASYCDADVRDRLRPLSEPILQLIETADKARQEPGSAEALEQNLLTAKGWHAIGALDPTERTRAMDLFGFQRQLVFATFSLYQFISHEDVDVQYGGARGHNRGIIDFCADDRRLLPVAFLPMSDPARSEKLLEEALSAGAKAVLVQSLPAGGRSPSHPDNDRIWNRLQDANVPLVLHVGGGGPLMDPAYSNNGLPFVDLHGGGESLNGRGFMAIHHSPEVYLSAMILDGLFDRFPGLRIGVIEQGASWVVDWMRRLDQAQRSFGRMDPVIRDLTLKPSEYVRRQMTFTPFVQEPIGDMIQAGGEELWLFSTDFPHPEGGIDPISRFEQNLVGVSDQAKHAFYVGNFDRLADGDRAS
jgi:predicted TIM-barrel fold metal-dependent hydrolase